MQLNSFDEWSPLKEVILGSASNYTAHARDLSFDLFYYDNLTQDNPQRPYGYYPRISARGDDGEAGGEPGAIAIKQRYVEELNEDVEGMAEVLRQLSVKVLRPMELDSTTALVTTPAWSAPVLPPLNVRDNTLVVGDEIIETPPMLRARYFETQFLSAIFAKYFERGSRWTVMPRPLMTDTSFDMAYASGSGGNTEAVNEAHTSPYDVGFEMMFDAAQCLRFGRDIIVNIATENHRIAVDWLERHLQGRFRIHRMHRLTDSHIDSSVLPLCPGRLLVRSRKVLDFLPEPLRRWDPIIAPPPDESDFPRYDESDLILTSPFIDLNVLSVDPETVLVNEACPQLMRTLEKHGFTTVPVRHRHRRLFGGGLHCFTLDTVREGGPEDYFG